MHKGLKYACNQCDYQATRQYHLTRHIQSIHEGVRYACNQCDKLFTTQTNLIIHTQSLHEGVEYACIKCSYQATRQESLTRHIQSIHEGVKYTCVQCDKQYAQKNDLNRHIKLIHKGVKFACDQQLAKQSRLSTTTHSYKNNPLGNEPTPEKSGPAKAASEMIIVSTCTIDASQFELNASEEEREYQGKKTKSNSEIANTLPLTVMPELTTHKRETNDPEKNCIHLLADNAETDHLNVFGLENTAEVVCPPSALGILLEDLVNRFESKENIPTDELLTIIDKIIKTEIE